MESTGKPARGCGSPPSIGTNKELQRGLYLTALLGGGAEALGREFPCRASGFWIEGGALAFPVQAVTLAGELPELLDAVGDDLELAPAAPARFWSRGRNGNDARSVVLVGGPPARRPGSSYPTVVR